ncbi:G kinase-anchoring protein 1-like [Penaeus indicus]|uniref:G kinase-anchoring protein 1-like n=1 Tax=Penaeus indicus TaxID=29960 RepID=UPI00300D506A
MSSRFGLLAVDVEPGERANKKKQDKPKPKTDEKNKKAVNKNSSKKKKNGVDESVLQLQAMAFGTGKAKAKKKSSKSGDTAKREGNKGDPVKKEASKVNGEDGLRVDEEWQRRDDEFVRDENERSLREALMLSKLDFEEKEKTSAQLKKERDEGKGGKVKKKKDKPVTMSLEQFNNLTVEQLARKNEPEVQEPPRNENEHKFFDDLEETTRKTMERETRKENYKATAGQFNHAMRVSEYEAEIEKRDFEIQALRLEVESLKNDLQMVKSRNKKLCEVICSAEMKAKAELVVELDKMTKVREELTQEVGSLSAQLEQERSKVNQLTLDVKKQGKKKQSSEPAGKS